MAERGSGDYTGNWVPEGYRLEPDGVMEIGATDRPVEIPRWYRCWSRKEFQRLVVRSNGQTITRSTDGLILTVEERARPLAPHHFFDEDDILCFPGFPNEQRLISRIFEWIRRRLSSEVQKMMRDARGFKTPEWYWEVCFRQGGNLVYILRGECHVSIQEIWLEPTDFSQQCKRVGFSATGRVHRI